MPDALPPIVFCNGAEVPEELKDLDKAKFINLEYRKNAESKPTINIQLPKFVQGVYHLPPRILDLLEIASYIFTADRSISRGRKDSLENRSWSRSIHFVIKVRDFDFWNSPGIQEKLSEALVFMSGDADYKFTFQPGHSTPATGLFDSEEFKIDLPGNTEIVLYSGGLDSLSGIIEHLETTDNTLYLISHKSGQSNTAKTQRMLFEALEARYPGRLKHYKYYCSLRGDRADEETQRTRAFLYSSIAYSLAFACSKNNFFIYENGITGINFRKRQDLINAKASRTTHPKTVALLEEVFSEINNSPFTISTPFLWNTKTDILCKIAKYNKQDLISSTVSCSRTFKNPNATHCGGCSQCIDRRLAAYAASLDDVDEAGYYDLDFIANPIPKGEAKETLLDYVRQAGHFATWNSDYLGQQILDQLTDLADYIPGLDEIELADKVFELCKKHGTQVQKGIKRIREIYDDPYKQVVPESFLQIINDREYLKEPIERLIEDIVARMKTALPKAFHNNLPKNENDFNDKFEAFINDGRETYEREHPAVSFALGHVFVDHSLRHNDLLLESKYIRASTTPSVASEGIAADLMKYPSDKHILFIVYDPHTEIKDITQFQESFEKKRQLTTVRVIR